MTQRTEQDFRGVQVIRLGETLGLDVGCRTIALTADEAELLANYLWVGVGMIRADLSRAQNPPEAAEAE